MFMRLCLLLVITAVISSVNAREISPNTARTVGQNFIADLQAHPGFALSQNESVLTLQRNGKNLIYVLNISPTGFVLISADDASFPVLAYSFESNYSTGNQPENFINWINGYQDQIAYAIENDVQPDAATKQAWERLLNPTNHGDAPVATASVSPLLTSTWDQGQPYNDLCPEDAAGPGGHVWAGCVATAMSQVANYWRWPLQGTGSHGYTSGYGYLFADYENTHYNWEQMTNVANGHNFEMAQLQSHLGIAVDMMYGANGSGAYSDDAANALIWYFSMDPALHLEYAPNPINDTWKNLIKSELEAGRPLYYHGFGSGGHAFNLDGYEGSDYFHFNWGWSGSFNGYYYLSNLNPGGSNFSEGQGAIVGIQPTGNYPYYCNSTDTLRIMRGTIEDGSGPTAPYLGNTYCSWLIMPEDSITNIKLTFHRFDLNTNGDYLTIYGGTDSSSPVIASYTGSSIPPVLNYNGGALLIKFTTLTGNSGGGWFASFEATKAIYCTGITTYEEPTGSFNDGSGTFEYHPNSLCRYKILPPNAQSITLSFDEFNTFDENDYIKVMDLNDGSTLATLFGNQNPGIMTFNTGKLMLLFHSNATDNASGWSVQYTSSLNTGTKENGRSLFELYPNPASEVLTVSMHFNSSTNYSLLLVTPEGKALLNEQRSGNGNTTEQIDLSTIPSGMYILKLITPSETLNRKIIVKH